MQAHRYHRDMILVGLTGGMGAGKSTVARMLERRGAVVIDADVLAREVVEPGTPGFDAVVARFGVGVLGQDGRLDRAALARLVFDDEAARADLNGIVHPLVARETQRRVAAAPPGSVVVMDVPLLVEAARGDMTWSSWSRRRGSCGWCGWWPGG